MPRFERSRDLPFPRPTVFDVVADIERYPEFVPGCRAARILERRGDWLEVHQELGAGGWYWRFRTQAELARPERLHITTREHPFARLDQTWSLEAIDAERTRLRLRVDYRLRSALLERLASGAIEQGFVRTLGAFERRARQLAGHR